MDEMKYEIARPISHNDNVAAAEKAQKLSAEREDGGGGKMEDITIAMLKFAERSVVSSPSLLLPRWSLVPLKRTCTRRGCPQDNEDCVGG